jgi:lysophospholipase L1-like esterase
MRLNYWTAFRRGAVIAAGVALAASSVVAGSLPASAAPRSASARPVVAGAGYLALGDSITFGYQEAATTPAPVYTDARSFIGFPEDLGADLGLKVANAACPGETTASFMNIKKQSNGCLTEPGGSPGYRAAYPLHVKYAGSQLSYAVSYLKAHSSVRLVSLMIGANDAFLCEETTKDKCANQLPGVLAKIGRHVATILKTIRTEAGYTGQLVIVNYYSLDYASALDNAQSKALNGEVDASAAPFKVRIANGYQAFRVASVHSKNNPCTAGLLTQLSTGGCGIHPSVAGQSVLAESVARVVTK